MTISDQEFWLPDPKWWAVTQERKRHDEALYAIGEYTLFVLMWTILDFERGSVTRCSTCYQRTDRLIQEAYHQASSDLCPDCFGTTFEGGWKAMLVRPAVWAWSELNLELDRRGELQRSQAVVDGTSDFRGQPHDYLMRADGSRYKVQTVDGVHLTSGFGGEHSHTVGAINYSYSVVRANESDPAYQIGPIPSTLVSALNVGYARRPVDFASTDSVRDGAVIIF